MKKFLFVLIALLLVFLGLTYWSVSTGPSEVVISQVVESDEISEEYTAGEEIKVVTSNRYEANGLKAFHAGRKLPESLGSTRAGSGLPAGQF